MVDLGGGGGGRFEGFNRTPLWAAPNDRLNGTPLSGYRTKKTAVVVVALKMIEMGVVSKISHALHMQEYNRTPLQEIVHVDPPQGGVSVTIKF